MSALYNDWRDPRSYLCALLFQRVDIDDCPPGAAGL
jgi:hypothetical protein